MIDLGIHMVRSAGQNDALAVIILHPFKNFLTLMFNVFFSLKKLLPGLSCRSLNFCGRNVVFLAEYANQSFRKCRKILHREEGMFKIHIQFSYIFHIVFNIFRITGYNRAVIMIIGISSLIALICYAWIENESDT